MEKENNLRVGLAQIAPVWLNKMQTLDYNRILEERQNFDPSGHYSRPDVTKLSLNRKRQSILDVSL